MSNIAQLRKVVRGLLQIDFPGIVRHALLNNSTPVEFDELFDALFLQAANNARKFAELSHDFQCAEVSLEGVIPVDGKGISWDNLTDPDEDDSVASLRSMTAFHVVLDDKSETPVNCKRKSFLAKREYDRKIRRTHDQNYPTNHEYSIPAEMFHHRRRFYCDPVPTTPIEIRVDGYKWFPDYADSTTVTATGYDVTLIGAPSVIHAELQPILVQGRPFYAVGPYSLNEFGYPNLPEPGDNAERFILYWDNEYWDISYYPNGYDSIGVDALSCQIQVDSPLPPESGYIPDIATLVPFTDIASIPVDDLTDYFLLHGFAYMQWATVVELNHLIQRFVPRQEGSIGPPTKERDVQLALLINNDVYATESGDYHDIRDE